MKQLFKWGILLVLSIAIAILIILKFYPDLVQKPIMVELSTSEELISDGPYLFFNGDSVSVEWVENSSKKQVSILQSKPIHITRGPNFKFKTAEINSLITKSESNFNKVQNIAVLSDIHGQYDLYIELMLANKLIDKELNWNYKDGHLVIIGDAFDRGDKVNETLWHIIKLSQQASKQGGKVHYLLGNHDVMVLNGDLRYIHDDYKLTERLLNRPYDELYGTDSWIGQWLRQQPVAIQINDIVFNHAGLSPELMRAGLSINDINTTFAESIIDNKRDSIRANPDLSLLARSKGPIWYRGYFRDTTLTTVQVDSVLTHFNANRIVVGHTSMDKVEHYFDTKVIAADTSIKNGENGEILFIENGQWYRGNLLGERKLIW
ncbi:metallophosphoesterase [Carboxylicivirga sp. N1Y90]|uniref:metallophosphoesterase n=1 Tax=Carboxylicivirga fragile TaxID=3417571 RepID=UPI003D34BCEF|nr:metallophosphoesterase [Marinilabiliaceae bacterium N1Y90]